VSTANGTRVYAKPVGPHGDGHTGPQIRDGLTPADTLYTADPGLQCRPGNAVVLDGELVPVDPEWWYPAPSDQPTIKLAKRLCRRCPALLKCRAVGAVTARQYGGYGVWGGIFFGADEGSRKRRKAS
jgi:hypothetical protein